MNAPPKSLVFVGDVHLDAGDPALPDFLSFLDGLATCCERLVLMGDLFNLWLGDPAVEQAHHTAVVRRLERLRDGGLVVRYLEGNRDYRIADGYTGRAFDDAGIRGIEERYGGKRLFAVHGDLVNRADRQYRAWRAFSRSSLVWALSGLLPRRARAGLAARLERRMRRSNLAFKRSFPESDVRDYAAGPLSRGFDAVVLGHFHLERQLEVPPVGRVFVLPEWKESRRHLEVTADGVVRFADSSY